MSWDNNVYYHPEKSGLVLVDSLDRPNMSYEYETLIVLQHIDSGRIFYAQDSGCSCPVPFEDFYLNRPDDTNLIEVNAINFSSFESDIKSFGNTYSDCGIPLHEREAIVDKVKKLLKK